MKPFIKIIGVGGGGCNAVNEMYRRGIEGVEFIVCNTDYQALQSSPVPNQLQIGKQLTQGLGAGANPKVGARAAEESLPSIQQLLEPDLRMLFITCGMGGGTGTGAAPIIAQQAHEKGILTVGIVTFPFSFEGKKKSALAREGIEKFRAFCDTSLVIHNDHLKGLYPQTGLSLAFQYANDVLHTAAKGIAEIITVPGYINVDFEDVNTIMRQSGKAIMGSGKAKGKDRAVLAVKKAISSPLLDQQGLEGASRMLLSIRSGLKTEMQMDELSQITDYIAQECQGDLELIFGHGTDPSLEDEISVTLIATGFPYPNDNSPAFGKAQENYIQEEAVPPAVPKLNSVGSRSSLQQASGLYQRYQESKRSPVMSRHQTLWKATMEREKLNKVYSINDRALLSSDWEIYEVPTFIRKNIFLVPTGPRESYSKVYDLEKFKD